VSTTLNAGDTLTTDSNNNAGQIVDAVVDENGLNILAVVNIDTEISELSIAGTVLEEVELPYSIVVEDSKQG